MRRAGALATVVAIGGFTVMEPAGVSGPAGTASLLAAQRAYEDVIADLRSSDPAQRIAAMRALAAASYPEAMAPIAALLSDPIDDIQLEAIDTLLAFVVPTPVATYRRVALVVEVRNRERAQAVFEQGPFALIPRPVVPEVVAGLAAAMRDDSPRVRLDATYALGVLAQPPVGREAVEALGAGLRDPDKAVRLAAARVAGALRVTQLGDPLIEAINDRDGAVRAAAMRAVGDIREPRAVVALGEQFEFYRRGELARAALDGLARIAHPSSVPLFQQHLVSKDPVMRRLAAEGLARSGRASLSLPTLESRLGAERDEAAALAVAWALATTGRPALDRVVAALGSPRLAPQGMLYLTQLGPAASRQLIGYLQDPQPAVRERVAMVLGLIGDDEALRALEAVRADPDVDVARAAERAIARVRLRR